jgi:ribosomal protein S18 acetylase RimI-like enzyme
VPSTSEPLRLRRAGPQDAGAVRELSRAAYARWVPVIGREPRPMTADYDRAVVEHRIDLLEEAGQLIALIETVVRPDDLLIINVAVASEQQGRGLGQRLLAHADDLARQAGRRTVRLYTNARMTENIARYTRLGFGFERSEELEVGTVVHMAKHLGNPA